MTDLGDFVSQEDFLDWVKQTSPRAYEHCVKYLEAHKGPVPSYLKVFDEVIDGMRKRDAERIRNLRPEERNDFRCHHYVPEPPELPEEKLRSRATS
jgi:hypothetical protein